MNEGWTNLSDASRRTAAMRRGKLKEGEPLTLSLLCVIR